MPFSQGENWDKTVLPELDIQKMPKWGAAAEQSASLREGTLFAETKVRQSPYRVVVVDDEPSIYETASPLLQSEGYEALTAAE